MTYNTDLETIENLQKLQGTINELLKKCEERLSQAQELQATAEICQEQLEVVTSVHEAVKHLETKQGLTQQLAKIEATTNFLDNCESQYQDLQTGLEAAINHINSLLAQEEEATNKIKASIVEIQKIKHLVVQRSVVVEIVGKKTIQAVNSIGGDKGVARLVAEINKHQNILKEQIALEQKTAESLNNTQQLLEEVTNIVKREDEGRFQQIEKMQQTLQKSLDAIKVNQNKNRAKLEKLETRLLKLELKLYPPFTSE